MTNLEKIGDVLAALTDDDVFKARLGELKAAADAADRKTKEVEKLASKYATADAMVQKAVALAEEAKAREVELVRRQAALEPAEKELRVRAKALDDREEALIRRERQADQRHEHLSEIARTAAA